MILLFLNFDLSHLIHLIQIIVEEKDLFLYYYNYIHYYIHYYIYYYIGHLILNYKLFFEYYFDLDIEDFSIIMAKTDSDYKIKTLGELLPDSFSPGTSWRSRPRRFLRRKRRIAKKRLVPKAKASFRSSLIFIPIILVQAKPRPEVRVFLTDSPEPMRVTPFS